MHIQTELLKAFIEVHREGSFTKAAKKLALTQSALSQKIARLEDQLSVTLFIRENNLIELTPSGEKLLLFAKDQLEHEHDFLNQFLNNSLELSGVLRVASFSSIMSSAVIPTLSNLMRNNPKVSLEFTAFQMQELENVLKINQADIIITDYLPQRPNLESIHIGGEEYVVIESKDFSSPNDIYLDHNMSDNATELYLSFQNQIQNYERRFMGNVYGIVSAVEQGLGRAVMSKHIIKNNKKIKTKKFPKRYFRKIYLSYFKKGYYSPLQKEVVSILKSETSDILKFR